MRKVKNINQQIGVNIRTIRAQAGHTQEKLAEMIGITPNHLSAIERGVSGASLEIIRKMCTLYAVSADAILFGEAENASADELAERLKNVRPEYRPQVSKVLLAMLEALTIQENLER